MVVRVTFRTHTLDLRSIAVPTEYIREIWQDGMMVAKVSCADEAAADREAGHYLAAYSQDGDVRLVCKSKKLKPK